MSESDTTDHTPLPWHIRYRDDCDNMPELLDAEDNYVPLSGRTNELAHRNAAFIVRACNGHDELIALLSEVVMAPPEGWSLKDAAGLNAKIVRAIAKAREQ